MAQFNVSFELKARPGNNAGSIRAIVTHGGKRIRFPIGHTGIARNTWDKKKHCVKGFTKAVSDANTEINRIRQDVAEWFAHQDHVSLSELPCIIMRRNPQGAVAFGVGSEARPAKGITALVEAYLADKLKPNNVSFSDSTIAGYKSLMRALVQFEEGTNTVLSPRCFALDAHYQSTDAQELAQRISDWLGTKHVHMGRKNNDEKGFVDSTRCRHMTRLSTVLKWAKKKRLAGISDIHADFGFGKGKSPKKDALTGAMIATIGALTIEVGTPLWHARNVFLLGIFTGLRHSDWHKINPALWREEGQAIEVTKTKTIAFVMHTEELRSILQHYENEPYPIYIYPSKRKKMTQNCKLNSLIRELCTLAKLTHPNPKIRIRSGIETTSSVPFVSLVTTRSCRKTFITREKTKRTPDAWIQLLTGIQDAATLKTYDCTTLSDLARELNISAIRNGADLATE